MSMWHTVLQDASFKGVRFDVMGLEESDGKTLVEHAKPFANGTLLEDMGTTGRQVQVSAVFWGKQYHGRLNRLLEALAENGTGVLVHPVWGRLQNMVAASWHFRHEADYVDYATLDITFRESGEPQKIFVFENQFLMELEHLIARLDTYRAALEGWIDSLMMTKQGVSALFGSALGLWSAARGTFAAVRMLFDLDGTRFGDGGEFQAALFAPKIKTWHADLAVMVTIGLLHTANISETGEVHPQDSRTPRQRFDAVWRQVHSLYDVPRQVYAGVSTQSAGGNTQAGYRPVAQTRLQRVTWVQVQTVTHMMRLTAVSVLFQAACGLIEQYGDSMNAPDLMHINRVVRTTVQNEIAALRDILQQAQTLPEQNGGSHALYEHTYAVIESLRLLAGSLNALVVAAINQKPPLVVRSAPLSGTLQQIAFAFYGDIGRTDELLRLNPHITHPSFIAQGDFINGYVQ